MHDAMKLLQSKKLSGLSADQLLALLLQQEWMNEIIEKLQTHPYCPVPIQCILAELKAQINRTTGFDKHLRMG
jgi:hypothetical protein